MTIVLLNHDAVVYSYNSETSEIVVPSVNLRQRLESGVAIPEGRLLEFGGKKIVFLADAELFHRAFKEIFFQNLDHSVFRWEIRTIR